MAGEKPAVGGARRVLIVEDDTLVGMGLLAQLEKLGHTVVGQASTAAQAHQLYRDQHPDFVLMDIRLDNGDGITLAAELLKLRRTPMIILSAYSDPALVERAADAGVYGYLIKPVSPEALLAQMQVALGRFNELDELARRNEALTQALEARKLIERAKGIFMKRLNLSEPEAHAHLQHESQRRRMSLTELAKRVIESEELLGGRGGA